MIYDIKNGKATKIIKKNDWRMFSPPNDSICSQVVYN